MTALYAIPAIVCASATIGGLWMRWARAKRREELRQRQLRRIAAYVAEDPTFVQRFNDYTPDRDAQLAANPRFQRWIFAEPNQGITQPDGYCEMCGTSGTCSVCGSHHGGVA